MISLVGVVWMLGGIASEVPPWAGSVCVGSVWAGVVSVGAVSVPAGAVGVVADPSAGAVSWPGTGSAVCVGSAAWESVAGSAAVSVLVSGCGLSMNMPGP